MLAFVAAFLGGYLIWMSGFALSWTVRFCSQGPYRLNHIPSKTLGVKKLSQLIGTLSLSFSLALCVALAFFYTAPWESRVVFEYVNAYIAYPFIIFAAIFIVAPQISIRGIIVEGKDRSLVDLEDRLQQFDIVNADFSDEIYAKYKNTMELYEVIFNTSNYALDLGTIGKFASSLLFPLLLSLAENPEVIAKLISDLH